MNYRNKKLLELANEIGYCTSCGVKSNSGDIVSAHSNQIRDGKGTGIKAHDFRIAYLCFRCHNSIDQSSDSYEVKINRFEEAHRKTIEWLFLSNHLKVV